jgi:large subunit ribosomal protein L25
MEVAIVRRKKTTKSEIKKLRIQGFIPAVIYGRKEENENVMINAHDFRKLLNQITPGRLSTTVFTLKEEKKEYPALIKDIQYDVTSYDILHLDFEKLADKEEVRVSVPIECIGEAESPGVKLGGIFRQTMRAVRVKCLPKDIPAFFQVSVQDLELGHTKRLKDISFPKDVKPLAEMEEVVVLVAKR